jgi:starch synthase
VEIVFAASECVPFAKTGGLADVVGALPQALAAKGHTVSVYLPRYRHIAEMQPNPEVLIPSLTIPFDSYNRFARIVDGGTKQVGKGTVQHYFVDCPELFDREGLYGPPGKDYADNYERFALFSRAVIEASKQLGVPDIFHVHDWQAAMIAIYLRSLYFFDPIFQKVPCVLSIHNAAFQGAFPPTTMQHLLLPWDMFTLDKLEHFDAMNFLKGGIVYADAITTVSRKYAEEIQTPEFGCGLDPVLSRRAKDLYGILNGVDYEEWDPAVDKHIAAPYSPKSLIGKNECRRDLLKTFGLERVEEQTAVIGIVSRFAMQKGFDLIAQVMEPLLHEDVVMVALGSGEAYYENLFREMQARNPRQVRVKIMYDDVLAHKIEAGADIFLMPSRYEPCGLNQIYSLKYGTVPVVAATGGLDDTIDEWDVVKGTGTGFKFATQTPEALLETLLRALTTYRDPAAWRMLMINGMAKSFTWNGPAKEYIAVYEKVMAQRAKIFAPETPAETVRVVK